MADRVPRRLVGGNDVHVARRTVGEPDDQGRPANICRRMAAPSGNRAPRFG